MKGPLGLKGLKNRVARLREQAAFVPSAAMKERFVEELKHAERRLAEFREAAK